MDVRFFIDENLGVNLVTGLRSLGYTNIEHISENFPEGTEDVVWLEYVGINNLILITKDRRIRYNPKEKAALQKYGIVVFYLGGKQLGIKEISKQLITAWNKMEACAKKQHKKRVSGAFRIRAGGGSIDEISLT